MKRAFSKKLELPVVFDNFFLCFYLTVSSSFILLLLAGNLLSLYQTREGPSLENIKSHSTTATEKDKETNMIKHSVKKEKIDERTKKLTRFFEKKGSPLREESTSFIKAADKYDIDWRLLPAIACKESGCGKVIPWNHCENKPSYNPFGWGVYGTNAIYFKAWQDGIEEVSKNLKENYYNNGLNTPELIEPIYTPPSMLKGRSWSRGVNYLILEIENS